MASLTTLVQLVGLISLCVCGVLVAADDYRYGRATMYYDNNQVIDRASYSWQLRTGSVTSVGQLHLRNRQKCLDGRPCVLATLSGVY